MEKIDPATSTILPTIDLSPFMEGGDFTAQKKVIEAMIGALATLGAFQIENHNVDHCEKLLDLTTTFFSYPAAVKKQSTKEDLDMAGSGYGKLDDGIYHDYEYILMYGPDQQYNGVPTIQPDYRETFNHVFNYFVKTSNILEEIINGALGLPPNYLNNYNDDRSWDYMLPMHYTLSDGTDNLGICDHEDPNLFTIILQDEVCGLEIFYNGEWIPVIPKRKNLVVIMSGLMEVLSNKKYNAATHRAIRNKNSKRLAIDFVYSFGPEKTISPLLTSEDEKPLFYQFLNQDFIDLVSADYATPPPSVEDFVTVAYYEI